MSRISINDIHNQCIIQCREDQGHRVHFVNSVTQKVIIVANSYHFQMIAVLTVTHMHNDNVPILNGNSIHDRQAQFNLIPCT